MRMDEVLNMWIRELCGVTKGVDERIDEIVLQCFNHFERITKRVYVGDCVNSLLVGRLQKR